MSILFTNVSIAKSVYNMRNSTLLCMLTRVIFLADRTACMIWSFMKIENSRMQSSFSVKSKEVVKACWKGDAIEKKNSNYLDQS